MTNDAYMKARQKYGRPQGMLWSENPGVLDNGRIVPEGYEINANKNNTPQTFLILSDDNRSPFDVNSERIGQRSRMVNGRMRSFHTADKKSISVSWDMLPSRSFSLSPEFDTTTGIPATATQQYTSDGGAGGIDILDWYENHTGPFYVYLAYDKLNNFNGKAYDRMNEYNEVVEMYIASFNYTVVRRGNSTFDFWNISLSLEEV